MTALDLFADALGALCGGSELSLWVIGCVVAKVLAAIICASAFIDHHHHHHPRAAR